MHKLLAALLGALPITTSAASTLDAGAFQLALSDDWVREQSSDPGQCSLRSKKESVHLTLSYTRMKAPSSRLEEVARKVVEFRLGAEQRAAAEHDLHLTIAEPIVVPFQQGFQVAYFGQDNRGRV